MLDKSAVIIAIVVILNHHTSWAWWPREYPRISLSRWLELDQEDHSIGGRWRNDVENMTQGYLSIQDQGKTFVATSQITGLGFECNATYPVKWTVKYHEDSDYYSFYTRVRNYRYNPDVFNPRSNTFTAQLDIFGEHSGVSGNYSCVSVEYPGDVAKSVYIYWQGTNPSNLILGGKNVDVSSKDGKYIYLPCRVSRPDILVNLYREINGEWAAVKSPYVKFNPKFGFRLNINQYTAIPAKFKCTVGEDEDEALIINARQGVSGSTTNFNNTMDPNASLFFNKSSQEIICCSSNPSSKPPKVHTIFCVDNFSCETRQYQLAKIINNGRRGSRNKSCTAERVYTKDSGILRCAGEGIDVVRNFYTELPVLENNRTPNLSFNWKDANPNNMVSISTTSRGSIYDGQNVTISCDTAFNYFADGMQWALRWKNQTLKFFKTGTPRYGPVMDIFEQNSVLSYQSLRLIRVNRNMSEVLCFAPVWNSTDWINKTITLNVLATKSPYFLDSNESQTINWKLNTTQHVLECRVKGAPLPMVRWKKNNATVLQDNNLSFKRGNGSISLLVKRVSHDVQGEYTCIATNVGGTVQRKFTVFVEDPKAGGSALGPVGLTILILMILSLLGGMGFLMWKMQLQKKVIQHLTGIVFRDVNNVNGNANTNVPTTTTTDPPSSVFNINHTTTPRGNSEINPFPSSL